MVLKAKYSHIIDLSLVVTNIKILYLCMCIIMNHNSGHSRDDKVVCMAHKMKLPENQPQFLLDNDGTVLVDKTNPKQAFRLTYNFQKVVLKILFNRILY